MRFIYQIVRKFREKRKLVFLISISTIIVLLPIAFFVLKYARNTKAVWFDTNWAYRQTVSVTNNTTTQTNYALQVIVDTASLVSVSKMQSDCDDARFASSSGTSYTYFLEAGCNTTKTIFWVTVDSIPAGASTFYFYYGNSGASTASTYIDPAGSISYGNGLDGDITISADTVINTTSSITGRSCADGGDAVNYSVTENRAGGTNQIVLSTTPSAGCLVVGDEVLIINVMGTSGANSDVGKYETGRITAISTATLTLNHNLTNGYDGSTQKIMVQRIPNYNDVTIQTAGTDFTATDYNGTKGGVMMFRADGTVSVDASTTINASGLGYRGGAAGAGGAIGGTNGESYDGTVGSGGSDSASGTSGGGDGGAASTGAPAGAVRGGGGGGGSSGGTISANGGGGAGGGGYGFGGGGGGGSSDGTQNDAGNGGAAASTSANGGGGGGGIQGNGTAANGGAAGSGGTTATGTGGAVGSGTTSGAGGGGGAAAGASGAGGGGGGSYGAAALTTVFLGSGGGGGGDSIVSGTGTDGGDGGGIVYIGANTINVSGNISSNGNASSTATANAGSGGSGAGGSVYLNSPSATLGSSLVTASGGAVVADTTDVAGAGAGGDGRIYVAYSTTSGTTSPTATTAAKPVFTSVATEQIQAIAEDPVLYWKFDEGYGTNANDSTGNSNTGTFGASTAAPTIQTEDMCVTGRCLKFDGSNDYVTKSYSSDNDLDPGTSSLSVSMWFKHSSTISGTDTLISRADGVNGVGYKLYYDATNGVCFGIDNAAGSFPSDSACTTTSYADSKWHFIEGVKNGTTSITLYIDGAQVGQDTSITSASISGSSSPLYVGIDADGTSNPWDGFIDDIKIYSLTTAHSGGQLNADQAARGSVNGASAVLGNYDTAFLNQGLVGYWKLDENTGTSAADLSGNGFTGTLTNGPTWASGKYGSSVNFDGGAGTNSDVITLGDQSTLELTTFTISAWIYRTGACQFNTCPIFSKGMNGSIGYSFEMVDTGGGYIPRLTIRDGSQNVDGTTIIAVNTWYHLTASIDGNRVKVYVNGALETDSAQTQTPNFSTEVAKIGNRNTNSDVTYNGKIDDVRVYNRALSPREVTSLYEWAPGPVGYWKMDENTGTTANDSTGNANTGTITAGTGGFASGKFGSAYNFDNANTQINGASGTNLDNLPSVGMTLDAWIYPNSQGESSAGVIMAKNVGTTPSAGWLFQFAGTNALTFTVDGSTDLVRTTSNSVITSGAWNHVAVSWDGVITTSSSVHIYINGVEVTYATSTDGAARVDDATSTFYIGNDSTQARTFDGKIDDARVYNFARTNKQIVQDMNADHPTVGTPVGAYVGYWKFDEGYGTSAHDLSINANTLTLSTASWTNSGKFGKAFNGGDNLRLTGSDDADFEPGANEDFSISTWVKSDGATTAASEYVVSKVAASAAGYDIYFNTSGQVVCEIDDDTASYPEDSATTTTDYYDQTWHHIVCVRDIVQDKLNLYIDGKLAAQDTDLSATGAIANTATFFLGDTNATNGSDEFLGDIDETKFYRASLSASDVRIEYNQGKSIVLGALSTESDGTTASFASAREFCVPGDTATCSVPVGEWKFDENTGTTANDTSENDNPGTLTLASQWRIGKKGSAVHFDETANQLVDMAKPSVLEMGTSDFSIEAWARLETSSTATSPDIINKGATSSTTPGYIIEYLATTTNAVAFRIADSTSRLTVDSTTNIKDGKWHHVAAVADRDGNGTLYIDGKLEGTTDFSSKSASSIDNTAENFTVSFNNVNSRWQGEVDDVKVFRYTRTPAQIAWDYSRGAPVGWLKFDENTGTTANDSTGNSNSFTLSASSWATGKFNTAWNGDGTKWVSRADDSDFDFAATDDASIAFWFKSDSGTNPSNAEYLATKGTITNTGTAGYAIYANTSGNIVFGIKDDTAWGASSPNTAAPDDTATSTADIYDGTWHHIVATKTGTSRIDLYVDGKPDASDTSISATGTLANSITSFFGDDDGDSANSFNGDLDDVRIYRYVLTANQIKTLYNDNSAVRFAPLTGSP